MTAPVGVGVVLLPLTRLGPMLENNDDGEGSSGEDERATGAVWGGVTAMGEQGGEEESTMLGVAMLSKRNLRSTVMRRVRIECLSPP